METSDYMREPMVGSCWEFQKKMAYRVDLFHLDLFQETNVEHIEGQMDPDK